MPGPSRHPDDANDYKTNATTTTDVDAPMEASEPKPENHGHRWNLEEDQRLLHAFQSDKLDVRSPFHVNLGDHCRLSSCDCFIWMRSRSYPCGDQHRNQNLEKGISQWLKHRISPTTPPSRTRKSAPASRKTLTHGKQHLTRHPGGVVALQDQTSLKSRSSWTMMF